MRNTLDTLYDLTTVIRKLTTTTESAEIDALWREYRRLPEEEDDTLFLNHLEETILEEIEKLAMTSRCWSPAGYRSNQ